MNMRVKNDGSSPMVMTIGHSNRSISEFLRLVKAHDVSRIVDVRTIPRSRHNQQFEGKALEQSLNEAGVGYVLMPGLGGLRRPLRDSQNMGWRNNSFRGYADYMQTIEFRESLEKLLDVARHGGVAIMCAEAVPWRCHRSLIADALAVHGIKVEHIMSATRRTQHSITSFARVEGSTLVYPAIDTHYVDAQVVA